MKALLAESLGTFWLVFGGCGSAIFAATFPETGIGFVGVSLAFGLTVLTMAFSIGPISGCHLNPAVSLGLALCGRLSWKCLVPYCVAQIIGALLAGLALYLVASGKAGFDITQGFATNGYGNQSPGGYSQLACAITEIGLTAFFLFIILHVTTPNRENFIAAPIAIGLSLTLIHLISIPITNTSVNPARSSGVAVIAGGEAFAQLWFFWLCPLLGAVLGSFMFKLTNKPEALIGEESF